MNKKVKNTTIIASHIFDEKTDKIKKETAYEDEEINQTIGKISNTISGYIYNFHKRPEIIVISRQLEILLRSSMRLLEQQQMVMIQNEPVRFYFIFGIACITSPVLTDLSFEVY